MLDIANRALEQERWAREQLAVHAGRTVRVDVGPARRTFAIDAGGRLEETGSVPDLKLMISPWQVPALLARPERWSELVTAEGDAGLAKTLSDLALTLPWFAEEALAKVFGAVAGQKIADIGRRLLAFPDYAAQRFGEGVTSYIGDEAQLAVRAAEARRVAEEIAALAARVDALARRIDALTAAPARAVPDPPAPRGRASTKRRPG
jgi:ubiquinone biosynthesis protein UbiJ